MPFKRNRNGGRKSKYVTKRGLPFQMMKYAETKYHTLDQGPLTLPVPPSGTNVIRLDDIRRGAAENERVGNEVQVTGVYIRLIYEAALTGTSQYMRAILYSPRLISAVNPPALTVTEIPDPDNVVIWFDKTVLCTFTPGGGSGVMTIRKKFKPYMKSIWDTDLGGSIQKGPLILCLLGHIASGTSVSFSSRVYFKDL